MILDLMPYVIAALSLAGCMGLFVLLKAELHQRERKAKHVELSLLTSIDALKREVDQLRESAVRDTPVLAPRPSLNLSHRAQALRLARRGDTPAQIAAALGVPVAEIELMLKVHQAAAAARA